MLGTTGDVLTMYANVLKDRSANRVSASERTRGRDIGTDEIVDHVNIGRCRPQSRYSSNACL